MLFFWVVAPCRSVGRYRRFGETVFGPEDGNTFSNLRAKIFVSAMSSDCESMTSQRAKTFHYFWLSELLHFSGRPTKGEMWLLSRNSSRFLRRIIHFSRVTTDTASATTQLAFSTATEVTIPLTATQTRNKRNLPWQHATFAPNCNSGPLPSRSFPCHLSQSSSHSMLHNISWKLPTSWSRVLETLVVTLLVKKSVFTRVRHPTLSWVRRIQFSP
jgi:hypothetical protein